MAFLETAGRSVLAEVRVAERERGLLLEEEQQAFARYQGLPLGIQRQIFSYSRELTV